MSRPITMTFSKKEWQLIAIACAKAKSSYFINLPDAPAALKAIAHQIAAETGKDS